VVEFFGVWTSRVSFFFVFFFCLFCFCFLFFGFFLFSFCFFITKCFMLLDGKYLAELTESTCVIESSLDLFFCMALNL